MLGLKKLYEVDRIDLAARTTLDQESQRKLVDFLRQMGDRHFLESIGLYGFRLLSPDNDPTKIKWSVMIYERDADSNKVRLQADNIDEPFDMNEGMKLDLGSTAKLRTLTTYLEIIDELHHRYAGLSPDDLHGMADDAPDALTTVGDNMAWPPIRTPSLEEIAGNASRWRRRNIPAIRMRSFSPAAVNTSLRILKKAKIVKPWICMKPFGSQ